jgi:hypothetical protein
VLNVTGGRAFAIGALMLGSLLAGCSGTSLESFQFGKSKTEPPPDPLKFPADYKPQVADFLRRNIENPTKIRDAYIATPALKQVGNNAQQYITCVRYNPRDRRNQYEGPTQKLVIFLSGEVNQFLPGDPQMCAGLTYQRYPEVENMVP